MKNPRETATGVVVIRIILSRSTNPWLVRGRPRISRTTWTTKIDAERRGADGTATPQPYERSYRTLEL